MARAYASGVVTGLALGLVAAVFAPLWRPAVSRYGRPIVKATIKQGICAYELGRERLAELGETLSDLAAEAQVELATERAPEPAPGAETASSD